MNKHKEIITKFIHESKKLLDYARCVSMAIKYTTGLTNLNYYTRLLLMIQMEVESMNKHKEMVDKLVNAYFDEPEKSIKELFSEFAEDMSEEDKIIFFENLKDIVS